MQRLLRCTFEQIHLVSLIKSVVPLEKNSCRPLRLTAAAADVESQTKAIATGAGVHVLNIQLWPYKIMISLVHSKS